jgi:hypothetical protein
MPPRMPAGLLRTSLRFLTWVCVALLAILSLTPAEQIDAVRTDLPGQVERIIAYAASAAIAMAGYGLNRGAVRIIGCFWLYAGVLEYLRTSHRAGTRRLSISQRRRLEPCAAGPRSSSSGTGAQLH